ncbi:hypothetical protein [Spirobacillus cienkowskii]|uniref:hypothetical protein n=1 Tax=Spirobacillus cienkowskii TaxID=495820 RepID=UPI0030CE73A9
MREYFFKNNRNYKKTSNPSSYWLIAKVESNFCPRVIHINSIKKVLYGEKAVYYLKTTQIKNDENLDIGIFQINWKYHGSQ